MLESGRVARILGWRRGDFETHLHPAFFDTADEIEHLAYDKFAGANLSKYLIGQDGVTLVFLKPCDTYSFNQLVKEKQILRQDTYIIGVGCDGNAALIDMEEAGILERCRVCKKTTHVAYDEIIGESTKRQDEDGFADVAKLEMQDSDARYAFWQQHLARCIRCNACRNACPVCHCKKCVFDNEKYDTNQKANVSSFEEQMFHIIRAYHVAGRCTDCGECSRVCPQNIHLHLLNRKFIKDTNELFGEYQAGADDVAPGPLTAYDIDGDKGVGF